MDRGLIEYGSSVEPLQNLAYGRAVPGMHAHESRGGGVGHDSGVVEGMIVCVDECKENTSL